MKNPERLKHQASQTKRKAPTACFPKQIISGTIYDILPIVGAGQNGFGIQNWVVLYNALKSHKGINDMMPMEKLINYLYPSEL